MVCVSVCVLCRVSGGREIEKSSSRQMRNGL